MEASERELPQPASKAKKAKVVISFVATRIDSSRLSGLGKSSLDQILAPTAPSGWAQFASKR
jgi:hypothetical protein